MSKKIIFSGMMIAVGIILPFFTGQIPQVGKMLLPMHFPVFIAGIVCGWREGFLVGLITPILRSALFGMPVMYPMAISMSIELLTYGLVIGSLLKNKKKNIFNVYTSLLISMLAGRIAYGTFTFLLLGIDFTWSAFLFGTLYNAVPGILLQLLIIPLLSIKLDSIIMNEKEYSY